MPLGVVAMVYEARPNVTVDAAGLTLKSGNAALLRGSASAIRSNRALVAVLSEAAAKAGLPADAVQLVPGTDRSSVGHLMRARGPGRRGHPARRRRPDPLRGRERRRSR